MKRFYEHYTRSGGAKYYRTLKALCDAQGLEYTPVYYRINKGETFVDSVAGVVVKRLHFEESK